MKNKNICVYCNNIANTKEHVPPKCFLDKPFPFNLKTVPACGDCNKSYSKDEEYIMYLADYLFSVEYANGDFTRKRVESTFNHSDKLENRMINSLKVDNNGEIYFDIESERVTLIIEKISIGLLFLHYNDKKIVSKSNFICIPMLSQQQKWEYENINWIAIQKNRFKYFVSEALIYFVIGEILLCVSSYSE